VTSAFKYKVEGVGMMIELNKVQKGLVIIALLALAPLVPEFIPELIYLIDLGGLEIIVTLTLMYVKPLIDRLQRLTDQFFCYWLIAKQATIKSAVAKPKVFAFQGVLCASVFAITGSMVLSAAFFMPVLLANGLLV
jgi:hypothetical protein